MSGFLKKFQEKLFSQSLIKLGPKFFEQFFFTFHFSCWQRAPMAKDTKYSNLIFNPTFCAFKRSGRRRLRAETRRGCVREVSQGWVTAYCLTFFRRTQRSGRRKVRPETVLNWAEEKSPPQILQNHPCIFYSKPASPDWSTLWPRSRKEEITLVPTMNWLKLWLIASWSWERNARSKLRKWLWQLCKSSVWNVWFAKRWLNGESSNGWLAT